MSTDFEVAVIAAVSEGIFSTYGQQDRGRSKRIASAVLAAAMPLIREAVATALEGVAGVMEDGPWQGRAAEVSDIRDVAARFRDGTHPVEVSR